MQIREDKIRKYQAGGSFMVYEPLPIMPKAESSQPQGQIATTPEDSANGFDKEMIKKLMGEGVSNDVMAFSQQIDNAYQEYAQLSEFERTTSRGQQLRNVMKGDLGQLNLLMRNKKQLDESITQVKNRGAHSELAITARGVMVKDLSSGELMEISHERLAEDLKSKKQFRALTNAELINEREYNPYLVNDMNSINALNSSVGMEDVKKEVTTVLAHLGSDSKKQQDSKYLDTNDYGTQQSAAVRQGAQQLLGMGPDGIYKVEGMRSEASNERQLKLAAQAMWANLSNNTKSLLKARAVTQGAEGANIETMAQQFAVSLLSGASNTAEETTTDATYQKDLSDAGKTGDEALTGSLGYYEALSTKTADPARFEINTGNNTSLTVNGYSPGGLQIGGKVAGPISLREANELRNVADFNNVYVGGNKVSREFIDSIIYDGDKVVSANLPAIPDGKGGFKPDMGRIELYQQAEQDLNRLPTAQAREMYLKSKDIPTDGKGNIGGLTRTFIMFNGMVNDRALEDSSEKGVISKHMLKEVGKNSEELYERLYAVKDEDGDPKYGSEYENSMFSASRFYFTSPTIYEGTVFIQSNTQIEDRQTAHVSGRMADGKDITTTKSANTIGGLRGQNMEKSSGNNVIFGFPN